MDAPPPLLLSLRYPWPENAAEETSLANLIPHIQSQRGHFRDVNESVLTAEIASPEPADVVLSVAAADAIEDPADTDRATQLKNAKLEIQSYVFAASTEARKALDYLSLLVSLHAPQVGASTLSPDLKGNIPAGALGVDWMQQKPDPKAEKDDAVIARAWKVEALNSAADALLGASKKLGVEVEKETKYWEQVLAIRDEGWLVTRMPRQRNALGVRYGFAEAALEFKNKGIGALKRGEDGSVIMDNHFDTGSRLPAVLRARVFKNGEVVGVSVQDRSRGVSSVKDKIRRARDFIYEEELFFELTREARVMASQGIRTSEDSVTIELVEGQKVVIDMAPLDDDQALPDTSNPASIVAQGVVLALRILLSYNHRLNLKKRAKPPPPLTNRKLANPPLFLIRPVTTHLYHQRDLRLLTSLLVKLRSFTTTAGLASSYTIRPLQNCRKPSSIHSVETAVQTFVGTLETSAVVSLPGGWEVGIMMFTVLGAPWFGTGYTVTTSHDGQAAKLLGDNRFTSHNELTLYLRWCLQRSVINEIRCQGKWKQETAGDEMTAQDSGKRARRIRVEVDEAGLAVEWAGKTEKYVWDGTERDKSLADILQQV